MTTPESYRTYELSAPQRVVLGLVKHGSVYVQGNQPSEKHGRVLAWDAEHKKVRRAPRPHTVWSLVKRGKLRVSTVPSRLYPDFYPVYSTRKN